MKIDRLKNHHNKNCGNSAIMFYKRFMSKYKKISMLKISIQTLFTLYLTVSGIIRLSLKSTTGQIYHAKIIEKNV